MSAGMGQFLETLDSHLQDGGQKLAYGGREQAVRDAVAEHSRIVPLVRRRGVLGTGTAYLSLPTGWDSSFSSLQRIEFPVGDVPPTYVRNDDWAMGVSAVTATVQKIIFYADTPGTAQYVNLEWTVPHWITDAGSSIPTGHVHPVSMLAASYGCLQLAAYYAQQGDPLIAIDSQDPRMKSDSYMTLARTYRSAYLSFFGIDERQGPGGGVQAAAIFQELNRRFQWGGPLWGHRKQWS